MNSQIRGHAVVCGGLEKRKATNERSEDLMRVLAISALVCALVPGLSATAEAKSSLKKLQSCLEFKDMTKPRLDCYDAIVPPQTKLHPYQLSSS